MASCRDWLGHARLNNVVQVSNGKDAVEFWCELQALHKKDGPTVASSLIGIVEDLRKAMLSSSVAGARSIRFTHCLVGDSVNTSENTATRVLFHFTNTSTMPGWEYFSFAVVVWQPCCQSCGCGGYSWQQRCPLRGADRYMS